MEAAHLLDLCDSVLENTEIIMVTPFLTLGISSWLRDVLHGVPIDYVAWGGFENAERVRFVLTAGKLELNYSQAAIALLQVFPFNKTERLAHRSILGSLMSLGLEREVIGDIRQSENSSIVAVTDDIKEYILHNWHNAGSESINVSLCSESISLLPIAGVEKRITSASPRLDSVVAASFNVSRSTMQEKIRLGDIQKNGIITLKPDVEVKVGDILSCRGKGKLRILTDGDKTRKGKNTCRVFMYTDN